MVVNAENIGRLTDYDWHDALKVDELGFQVYIFETVWEKSGIRKIGFNHVCCFSRPVYYLIV